MLHAEAVVGPPGDRLADPTQADDAQRLPGDLGPHHVGRAASRSRLPSRRWRSPSPARRATESRRVIARSAVQSVRAPGVLVTAMPWSLRGGDVDVVVADAEVGDDAGPAGVGSQHLGGDLVGHRREQRVGRWLTAAAARPPTSPGRRRSAGRRTAGPARPRPASAGGGLPPPGDCRSTKSQLRGSAGSKRLRRPRLCRNRP